MMEAEYTDPLHIAIRELQHRFRRDYDPANPHATDELYREIGVLVEAEKIVGREMRRLQQEDT